MRYQNWDVLVFPDQCKVPLQEFKTSCQVIQDFESHNHSSNPFLLPTVTSFIPGLPPCSAFRISIHSWQPPEISRNTQNLGKPSDTIVFEARLFIDGRHAGTRWFNQDGPWPSIVELGIDLDKNGEFEKLKFPTFHKELLSQSYWNAGDDLGRIKLVIAEGFSRENLAYPFERLKNLVSFSFQHAPLDVLESSSIAWPNSAMWRQVSLLAPYFAQQNSPQHAADGIEAHSHSPRHSTASSRPLMPIPNMISIPPPNALVPPRQPTYDPFTEPVHAAFKGWRQPSSDVSMNDYSSSNTRASSSGHSSLGLIQDRRYASIQMPDAFESLCEALQPSATTSTPQTEENTPIALKAVRKASAQVVKPISKKEKEELETSANPNVHLSAPTATNVKSRKENVLGSPRGWEMISTGNDVAARKPFAATTNVGAKRQRVVTPTATKVIDEEDEPRSSPSLRKVSRGAQDGERKVLGGIENI